jgi:hypothetical protein
MVIDSNDTARFAEIQSSRLNVEENNNSFSFGEFNFTFR